MSNKDIALTVTSIDEIETGYSRYIYIKLNDVDSDEVVSEFGAEALLESMDLDHVKSWLEEQGYTLTEDE